MKKIILTILFAVAFACASDKDYKMLETHAEECLDYLFSFFSEDYNPQKIIRSKYNGSGVELYFDEEAVAATDEMGKKWVADCGDLFDEKRYAPGFLRSSPLQKVVEARIKRGLEARQAQQGSSSGSASSGEQGESHFIRVSFQNGILQSIDVTPPHYKRFQYFYKGKVLTWDFFKNGVPLLPWSDDSFSFTFEKDYNGNLRYFSPFYVYSDYSYTPSPRIWKIDNVGKEVANGNFTFTQEGFNGIARGHNGKSWSLLASISAGLGFYFAYTDEMYEDNGWNKDSAAEKSANGLSLMIDLAIGTVHCMSSGRCFGFGTGYAKNYFVGYKNDDEDYYDSSVSEEVVSTDNIKVYGEFYFKTKMAISLREAIDIPLNADMKYMTSKTSFVFGSFHRFEIGMELSPIQCIPGIYIEYGYRFNTPALW